MKTKLNRNENAIAPLILALIILGAVAGTAVIGSVALSQPDITYNISDTGFSLAGVDVSWLMVIAVAGLVLVLFLFVFRKKPQPQQPIYVYRDRE